MTDRASGNVKIKIEVEADEGSLGQDDKNAQKKTQNKAKFKEKISDELTKLNSQTFREIAEKIKINYADPIFDIQVEIVNKLQNLDLNEYENCRELCTLLKFDPSKRLSKNLLISKKSDSGGNEDSTATSENDPQNENLKQTDDEVYDLQHADKKYREIYDQISKPQQSYYKILLCCDFTCLHSFLTNNNIYTLDDTRSRNYIRVGTRAFKIFSKLPAGAQYVIDLSMTNLYSCDDDSFKSVMCEVFN
jgi:hypothetical protein